MRDYHTDSGATPLIDLDGKGRHLPRETEEQGQVDHRTPLAFGSSDLKPDRSWRPCTGLHFARRSPNDQKEQRASFVEKRKPNFTGTSRFSRSSAEGRRCGLEVSPPTWTVSSGKASASATFARLDCADFFGAGLEFAWQATSELLNRLTGSRQAHLFLLRLHRSFSHDF